MASRLLEIQVQQQKCTACGTNMVPEISWRCHGCPYSERARKKAKGMIDNKGKGKTKRERVGGGHECRSCEMGTLRYPHPLTGSSSVKGEDEGNEDMEEIGYDSDSSGQACQLARAMGAF